ncbi:hypothetical protein [Gordonia alkaliphila]|uniref:Uncharacterized protein n=1 Tax=Gordonia alkaliphila TaxID=1053547 RepID=A0ABP8Z3G7_9ACTN
MAARLRPAARTGAIAVAAALAAALIGAGPTQAEPVSQAPALLAGGLQALSLGQIPFDAELAAALRALKAAGGDQMTTEALQAILEAGGQLDPSSLLPGTDGDPAAPASPTAPAPAPADPNPAAPAPADPAAPAPAPADPALPAPAPAAANDVDSPLGVAGSGLEALERLTGAKALTPAFAPFCGTPTDDNPLGLVTAPAVGFPGPFPKVGDKTAGEALGDLLDGLGIGALGDLLDQNQDLTEITSALSADQTAYALLPPAGHTRDNFQVAWFNTASMKGGLADLKPVSEITDSAALKALTRSAPIRMARVDTGQGSILTAVFGTTTNAGRTCFFLPAVGIVDTPAS